MGELEMAVGKERRLMDDQKDAYEQQLHRQRRNSAVAKGKAMEQVEALQAQLRQEVEARGKENHQLQQQARSGARFSLAVSSWSKSSSRIIRLE